MNSVARRPSILDIKEALEYCFPSDSHRTEIYETTGEENLTEFAHRMGAICPAKGE
jgi:hypothetical protein